MNVSIDYTISELAEIMNGSMLQQVSEVSLSQIFLDSRKLIFPESSIFFAVRTSHKHGIDFINELYEKGVRNFVVDEKIDLSLFKKANFILVKDTLQALQLLAIHHRKRFNIPVIGVTGSNGKTIVKEWLNQLLESDFKIVRSPKSYNSQIGVPLSVLQMNAENTIAIFEAGISQPCEMGKLQQIIQPTIGIFTNIGDAHSEGFENIQQKINEKLKLFTTAETLVYCRDYAELDVAVNFLKEKDQQLKLFSWSKNKDASLKIISVEKKNNNTEIHAEFTGKNISVAIPFNDDASVENAISCWCVLLHLEMDPEIISDRMLQLFPVEMRLEMKQGINNCSIINDSYSADINSLSIALDFLHQQKQHKKHTVILSDILQSGKTNAELYQQVASLLNQKNITRLIGIGEQISSEQKQFSFLKEKYFFNSVEHFKKHFGALHFKDEAVLLKGARVFEFEQISQLLEQKIHQTVLSVNLTAIAYNLKQYQQLLEPSTKIMAMVKAFSYGSGSYEVANLLQFNKIDWLAVAYADEGVELRKAGITLPIMVMNPEENSFSALIKHDLQPEIFSFSILSSFEKYLQSSAITNFPVHIKLDTGMHRLGFEIDEVQSLAGHLKNSNKIKVVSVFSHLVASEDEQHDDFTKHQSEIFLQACNILEQSMGYKFIRHMANTSAITRHTNMQMDMVRLGIGLYGIDSNNLMQSKLRNVTTLTTTISQIRKVKAGETVGYGRNAKLMNDAIIATVRIGYADGYSRSLGNGVGKMLAGDKLVPVIGNVCMDMTMLDVTNIKNIKEGDDVIVFGEGLPIQYLAQWSKTISYEIMTGISQRVNRIYFEE